MRQFVIPLLLSLVIVGDVRPFAPQTPVRDDTKSNPSNDPQLARWLDLKRELQGPNAKQYFETFLRDAVVPAKTDSIQALRGTVLSGKPAKRPTDLVLAMSDSHTPEVTVTLRDSRQNQAPLLRPLAPGTVMEFWGIPVSFTQNPFMLTIEVKVENGPAGANPRVMTQPRKTKP